MPRADARDLRLFTESGEGVDWPLEHAELVPYYERVEGFLGVSGPPTYPWDAGRRYPLPPVQRNGPADIMAGACDSRGIRWADAPAALVSREFQSEDGPLRHGCINCGFCHQGCRNGAKASMDVTYLPLAVAHGAEIRPECFVTGFERGADGRISAVIYSHGAAKRASAAGRSSSARAPSRRPACCCTTTSPTAAGRSGATTWAMWRRRSGAPSTTRCG